MRQSKCQICSDLTSVGQVNSLIESGVRQKLIHQEYPQFSVSQISRHSRNCRAPNAITGELPPGAGGDELDVWRQRCTDSYHLAVANGDSRSAISACSAATRQLVALAKRQEKEAAAKEAIDPTSAAGLQLTIAGIDAVVKMAAETGDMQNRAAPRAIALLNDEPSFSQIVQAIWANRAILPALLACCVTTDYLPPRQTTEEINADS